LELLERAESEQEYVSLRELRRLARDQPSLTGHVSQLLHMAVREGAVVWDDRQRITRGGRCVPWRLYRLNRRHPAVQQLGVRLDT
jgi:hypothetical protein